MLKLGDAPCIPFFINNYQFVPRYTIFLSLHLLCAMLGASLSSLFLVSFTLIAVSNKLDPTLFFVGEKHAPFKLEHLIGFACLFFAVSCSLSFLSCYLFSSCALEFSYRAFNWFRLELSIVCMFILFSELACCTKCVSCFE